MDKEMCGQCNRELKKRPKPDWCLEDEHNYRCLKCGEFYDSNWDLPDRCDRCKDMRRDTVRILLAGLVAHGYAGNDTLVDRAIELAEKMEDAL